MRYYESAFPVFASAEGVSYEIFLSGCHGYCEGCHSPHTHDFTSGIDLDDGVFFSELIMDIQEKYDAGQLDNVVIMGGEPLDHTDAELADLIDAVRIACPKVKIWMYTHFEADEVKNRPEIFNRLDWIKCGKFDKSKFSEAGFKSELTGVTLATSNQYFIKGGYK